jgi:AmmeMemoRadiSam system protein B
MLSQKTRPPTVAGSFYPADPGELARTIAGFMSDVPKSPDIAKPKALIAPHAGYVYSGLVAAHAYKTVSGQTYDIAVVISPCHVSYFPGASVFDGDAYATPLGECAVDREAAADLVSDDGTVRLLPDGHAVPGRGEHSLEVQLPFLQIVLGKTPVVPIVMGDQDRRTAAVLGERLAALSEQRDVLVVASSDLSHFHNEQEARALDMRIIQHLEAFDPDGLSTAIESGSAEACGGGPMVAALDYGKAVGAETVRVVKYATSADVSGDKRSVVGYVAAVIE